MESPSADSNIPNRGRVQNTKHVKTKHDPSQHYCYKLQGKAGAAATR